MFPQPSNFLSADSDSLYTFPGSSNLLEPTYPLSWLQNNKTRASRLAAPSKLLRSTRPHHQRRSKNILTSTSSTIFGHWNIPVKNETRVHNKGKGKAGTSGASQRGIAAMGTTPAASPTDNQPEPVNTTSTLTSSSSSPIPREQISEPRKPPLTFKTLRRMPSNLYNNSTTSWTIGQQTKGSNTKTQAVASTTSRPSSPSFPEAPSSSTSAPVATNKNDSQAKESAHAADAFTTRSKFLRAFGKFKDKHLSQKRANATDAGTTGASSVTSNNSISTNNATSASNSSSFVLPPTKLSHGVPLSSPEQGSSAHLGHSDITSVSMSHIESTPTTPGENKEQLYDIDMKDSEAPRRPSLLHNRPSSSSLRVKFKNRVNTTLASIKSSSNLREKAQAQAAAPASSTSNFPPNSPPDTPTEQPQSPSTPTTPDSQQSGQMIKLARPFWTFPRVRPESSTSSKLQPWNANSRPNSLVEEKTPCPKDTHPDFDTVMISPQLCSAPQFHNEEEPSSDDESIDIIMPSDYDDYTQFAELPLKKQKKLRARAAAAAAAADGGARVQDGSNRRPLKRFLLPHKVKSGIKENVSSSGNSNANIQTSPSGGFIIPQRNTKKRPKDQDSIEQRRQQEEPNKMAKSNSGEPSDWRRNIMRSLHIGRSNQASNKNQNETTPGQKNAENQIDTLSPPELTHQRDSGVYSGDQATRLKRSESVNSTRSRSLDTSTHPGLLATTLPKPSSATVTSPGSRRETLEMAMRRRRRSSTVRSIFMDPSKTLRPPHFLDDDAASAHVTHTFTSFTLELADIHHAQAVVNNSAVPGLFNFKRQPRLTTSSVNNMDTDHEFKGFDSEDAMSGYTGDADMSMEEIFVRPRTPPASKAHESKDKGEVRESSSTDSLSRRKMSMGDADSDTVPELLSLSARTRDMNRSNGSGRVGSSFSNGRESPRASRNGSPVLTRKAGRNFLSTSPGAVGASATSSTASSPPRQSSHVLSMEEVVSWKPRPSSQQPRLSVPALNTKGLPSTRTGGLSSLRTPQSDVSSSAPQSPDVPRHHRQQSSAQYSHHRQHTSADTLIPHHLKNFSTASTMTANSAYYAQTLNGYPIPSGSQPREFDATVDFSPSTPSDLKTMDFESLLRTAEREQQKGQEERTLKKKKSFQFQNAKSLRLQQHQQQYVSGNRSNADHYGSNIYDNYAPVSTKSALSALVASNSNMDEPRARGIENYSYESPQHSPPNSIQHSWNHNSNANKYGGLQVSNNRMEHQRPMSSLGQYPRIPVSKNAITFDLTESGGIPINSGRVNPRSKRVMKKKTSVIKLSGNVQGRREDDGMIRVMVTPLTDHRQWRAS
ncbi:hypothetical protein BX616_008897 [Lobosporangium transversale]|uniref:Uncharacterized protein n=1 Tax=Lobosporangium transversale TaxID=64571 RepID=A0A1Y2GN06_9FUNG|nr:hypothetical protein BCR41DRAFT_422156 [Lobosporangium transversale]KAF9914133.1 hypothetical protein BX616_008897 [Lobosporangium transversale]ORZ16149.1 hypothetical protein BCR41DRAFT_422156 [Lobosporangium transversale]|eukprot:XP_021881496.1 hypothetical protein BCR41DRAFT_422156 [Lobosporangium transversale]